MVYKSTFTVIQNNGVIENYSNTCFWISVLDFLTYNKRYSNITVSKLREICDFSGSNNEMIDYSIPKHYESIKKLCNILSIGIDFHYVNKKYLDNKIIGLWIGNCAFNINKFIPNDNRCAIACYGDHFELIISETERLPCKKIYNLPKNRIVNKYVVNKDNIHSDIYNINKLIN